MALCNAWKTKLTPTTLSNATAGRAGRDGVQSSAILYLYLGSLFGHVSKAMKSYSMFENGCRRKFLVSHFICDVDSMLTNELNHICCDICVKTCECATPWPGLPQTVMSVLPTEDHSIIEERVFSQYQLTNQSVRVQDFYDGYSRRFRRELFSLET